MSETIPSIHSFIYTSSATATNEERGADRLTYKEVGGELMGGRERVHEENNP